MTIEEQLAASTELLGKDIAILENKQPAQRRANAEPLPGPLGQAFGLGFKVAELQVRPVVAGDFIVLKHLNSPIYRRSFTLAEHFRQIKAGELPEETPFPQTDYSGEELAEMIHQFTNPLPQVRQGLLGGRKQFTERALRGIRRADSELKELCALVMANYSAAFATAVEYEVAGREDETTQFFLENAGKSDGLGWWLHYVARLCATFKWPLAYVLDELPLTQGFAFLAWDNECEPEAVPVTRRYIGQEIDRILTETKS